MDRIFITLALDLTSASPQPGWYLNVVTDGNRLMEPMPIPPETAYELAQDFQRAMQDSPHELPNFQIPALVQTGNASIYQAVQQQLQEAMEAAARVENLRRLLGTLQPPQGPQQRQLPPVPVPPTTTMPGPVRPDVY